MWKATEGQRISTQIWRIPREKISIIVGSERPEEAVECRSIHIRGVFHPHNSEPILLKRGQTIGLVMSCIVMQAEQGQLPKKRKEA